jgi:Mn-dependent DtxR family transcriptional regulator
VVARSVSPLRASDLQRETEHREQRALAIIKANPLVSVRGLAESLGCAASTSHAILKKPTTKKWVKRRAKKLMLTDEGEEVLNG